MSEEHLNIIRDLVSKKLTDDRNKIIDSLLTEEKDEGELDNNK